MKDKVIEYLENIFLEAKVEKGIYIPTILNRFNIDFSELKQILNDLHKEKKILVRQGINGKLIYYKQQKT